MFQGLPGEFREWDEEDLSSTGFVVDRGEGDGLVSTRLWDLTAVEV